MAESQTGRVVRHGGINGRFSLVELLAVLGIVCLLAAFLLPSLLKSQETAKGSSCINNLRQMGVAFHGYAGHYDDNIPRSYIYANSKTWRWYHAMQPDLDNMNIYICPLGHKTQVPKDDFLPEPPVFTYVWNSMRRDKNYYPDVQPTETDLGAHGLTRGDGAMSCLLFTKLANIAPDTLAILDGGLGDRSTGVGKALVELSSIYSSNYYSGYDWRDLSTREAFTKALPGVNFCHGGGANGLRADGGVETVRRIPFNRLTIRQDSEVTFP